MIDRKKLQTRSLLVGMAAAGLFAVSGCSTGSSETKKDDGMFKAKDCQSESMKGAEGCCGENKCGEGKCGENKDKMKDGSDKGAEGSCGEHKCGEGKCA